MTESQVRIQVNRANVGKTITFSNVGYDPVCGEVVMLDEELTGVIVAWQDLPFLKYQVEVDGYPLPFAVSPQHVLGGLDDD